MQDTCTTAAGDIVEMTEQVLRMLDKPGARLTYGIVTASSPLAVMVGASTVGVLAQAISGASFTTGDYVAVVVQDADRLVLGKVTTGGALTSWITWDNHIGTWNGGGLQGNNFTGRVGKYRYDGDMIDIQFGWGTTGGGLTAGPIVLELPVAPLHVAVSNTFFPLGLAHSIDQGTARYNGIVVLDTDIGTTLATIYTPGGTQNWTDSYPMVWANTDAGGAILRYPWR